MSDLIKRLDRLAEILIETPKFSSYCQLIYEVSNELAARDAEIAGLRAKHYEECAVRGDEHVEYLQTLRARDPENEYTNGKVGGAAEVVAAIRAAAKQ